MEANKPKNLLLLTLVVAAGFGLAGGVVGQLLTQSYFMERITGLSGLAEIDFSGSSKSNLVISAPKKVVVEQNDKVAETVAGAQGSLVGIYRKKTAASGEQAEAFKEYFEPSDLKGQGLILTSDGWLVTSLAPAPEEWSEFIIVTADRRLYQSDKQLVDPVTGLSIIHIPAKDLPVKGFADPAGLDSGQLVLSVGWLGVGQLNTIIEPDRQNELAEESDRLNQEMVLDETLKPEASGPAIFNLAGEVAALVTAKGKILPASQFSGALPGLSASGKLERPSLGLSYADLSRLVAADASDLSRPKEGALVLASATGKEKNLGLEPGDIITQVGGRQLTRNLSLGEAIQGFKPGAKAQLVYWRAGAQREAAVRFELLK